MVESNKEYPFVSALIVTRNEQVYVEKALLSLINQTYPKDRFEIIVIDGESTDNTVSIVREIIKQYRTTVFDIRVINNPKHILSSGWNLGIKNSKGKYVVRIDAHAEASPDFIEKSIKTIQAVPDAVCVGGKLKTMSLNGEDDVISKVLSSSFGVGNSSFRVSNTPSYSDTAVYGLYDKSVFEEVGFFDERFVRNQDIELHSRIRNSGGKFFFNPEISCVYYSRNTTKKMIKQAFGNGKWNMVLLKYQKSALKIRHLVPFAFVCTLIISSLLGLLSRVFLFLELGIILLHLICGLLASLKKTHKINELVKMPFLFFLLHVSYGLGYWSGLFSRV